VPLNTSMTSREEVDLRLTSGGNGVDAVDCRLHTQCTGDCQYISFISPLPIVQLNQD
jgi:hypothetical protein